MDMVFKVIISICVVIGVMLFMAWITGSEQNMLIGMVAFLLIKDLLKALRDA